jgi:hypothetical protein
LERVEEPDQYVLFMDMRTFAVSKWLASTRQILDYVTGLHKGYVWSDVGTAQTPFVVLQPQESKLSWPVERKCGGENRLKALISPGGELNRLFLQRNYAVILNVPEMSLENRLDLCRSDLTALQLINLTANAMGPEVYWTLGGIKGLRFLRFDDSDHE